MPKIIKNSITYGSSSPMVELTQAEYNALSSAQKNNGTIYLITDSEPDAFSINTLSDVSISSPTNNQTLAYDSSNHKWKNSSDFVTTTALLNNLVRFNISYAQSLSTTVGRSQWLCVVSNDLFIVWFYSTSSVAAKNVGTNVQVIGSEGSATIDGSASNSVTFTRGTNNTLAITTTNMSAITIIG